MTDAETLQILRVAAAEAVVPDAPACCKCGTITVRSGDFAKCLNCGHEQNWWAAKTAKLRAAIGEPAPPTHYYFGCWDRPGHHLFDVHGRMVREDVGLPGYSLDNRLCPNWDRPGAVRLLHLLGRTFLAFRDSTVDSRPGSNSVFILEGTHEFQDATKLASTAFPTIWARYAGWTWLRD